MIALPNKHAAIIRQPIVCARAKVFTTTAFGMFWNSRTSFVNQYRRKKKSKKAILPTIAELGLEPRKTKMPKEKFHAIAL